MLRRVIRGQRRVCYLFNSAGLGTLHTTLVLNDFCQLPAFKGSAHRPGP